MEFIFKGMTPRQCHDRFFRIMMAKKQVARDFFIAHLPIEIKAAIDLNSLTLESNCHLDAKHRESRFDIVYRTHFIANEYPVYLLVEHQSSIDPLMAYRVAKYEICIMEYHLQQHDNIVPYVIAFVVYHGPDVNSMQSDITNLLPVNIQQRQYATPGRFEMISLDRFSDKSLLQFKTAGLLEYALKHIYDSDQLPCIENILNWYNGKFIDFNQDLLHELIQYLVSAGNLSDHAAFYDIIEKKLRKSEGVNVMSFAQDLINEGISQGVSQGFSQGISQGIEQGGREMALKIASNLIKTQLSPEAIAETTGLSIKDVKILIEQD